VDNVGQLRWNPVIEFLVERDVHDNFGNGRFHTGKIVLGIAAPGTSIIAV